MNQFVGAKNLRLLELLRGFTELAEKIEVLPPRTVSARPETRRGAGWNNDSRIRNGWLTMGSMKILSILDFGAVPNNPAFDAFGPMSAAAAAISNPAGELHSGCILVFPPGTYYVHRFRGDGKLRADGTSDEEWNNAWVVFRDCENLQILGAGAIIDLFGGFRCDATHCAALPFYFLGCSNFLLDGFEINGNVNHMTRDPQYHNDPFAHGVTTRYCSNYVLSRLQVHHCHVDGILIGGAEGLAANPKAFPDHHATLIDVQCHHNARNGFSVIQARHVQVINCEFSRSGYTEGSYPGQAPQAGVDIEPDFADLPPTGDILFWRCHFHDTVGQLLDMSPIQGKGDAAAIVACSFADAPERRAPRPGSGTIAAGSFHALPSGPPSAPTVSLLRIESTLADTHFYLCRFDFPAISGWVGAVEFAYSGGHMRIGGSGNARAEILECDFRSGGLGLMNGTTQNPLLVEHCRFVGIMKAPMPLQSGMPCLNPDSGASANPLHPQRFIENYVFRPAVAFDLSHPPAQQGTLLANIVESSGNWFNTDLSGPKPIPIFSGNPPKPVAEKFPAPGAIYRFTTDYYSTAVSGDNFPMADLIVVVLNPWRPLAATTPVASWTTGAANPRQYGAGNAPPNAGTWNDGDVYYNTDLQTGPIGWRFTGNPKSWVPFGTIQ